MTKSALLSWVSTSKQHEVASAATRLKATQEKYEQTRFIPYIYGDVRNMKLEQIKTSKSIAVMVDSSTDVSTKNMEAVYVRYIVDGSDGGVRRPEGKAGCDGAAVMVGRKGGLVKQMKDDVPCLLSFHCVVHRLELAGSDAMKDEVEMKQVSDIPTDRVNTYRNKSRMTDLPLGIAGVSLQQIAAYKSNYGAHRKGITNEEVIAYYNTWAEERLYEDELNPSIYQGPRIAAETLAEHYDLEIRPNVKVIDVAAGSGLLGEQLYRRGFTQLDALDPSDSMLQLATQKRIYHRLLCAKMDGHRTECLDDDYDALIVSGGMGEGHIPVTGLNEMARIVKPGGLVVIVMRNEYLDYVTEYKDKLVPHMLSMQARGLWEMVDRKIVEKYSFNKDGVVFTFRCL